MAIVIVFWQGRCVRREKITNCLDTQTTQQPIRRLTNHIFRQIPIKIQILGVWYLKSPPIKEKVNYSGWCLKLFKSWQVILSKAANFLNFISQCLLKARPLVKNWMMINIDLYVTRTITISYGLRYITSLLQKSVKKVLVHFMFLNTKKPKFAAFS